jgi:large subunit ribosomal protein L13
MKRNKTIFAKTEEVQRGRYLVDASGKTLGRLASKVAVYLRGKNKVIFTPQTDCGDYITVINADKIKVTARKNKDKTYFTHSGYPGGDKLLSFEKMMETKPERVIELAVAGMIPHNRLGSKVLKKMRVFKGERPEYQKWEKLEV